MADILEYLSRDHRITFETIDQIRMVPRSDLPPQEQLRASLRFREAENVLRTRVGAHVTALAHLANQINSAVERGQKNTNSARKLFDGVHGIGYLIGSARQHAQTLKPMADVADNIRTLINGAETLARDEYKFEHCLDYYLKLDKMLSELTSLIADEVRRPPACRLDSLSSTALQDAIINFVSALSGPVEEATQNIADEQRLRDVTVQRLESSPPCPTRVIKRPDRYEQANPRLHALCNMLREDLKSAAPYWEFSLSDVCSRLKGLHHESMFLGPVLSISLHRRTDSLDREMLLIEFGGGALSPTWVRIERSARWTQFGHEDSLPHDCVARAWTKDTIIISCDHDYLSQSSYYVEVCVARYWPNGRSMHLDDISDLVDEVATENLPSELLEEDCRSFARRLFHRLADAEPGALNSVTWRGRRCSLEDVMSSIHRYAWHSPGGVSRNLQSGESQAGILLEVACFQLLCSQPSSARLAMEAAIDIATSDQHSARFLPECYWILSHAYQALGDPSVALEFAMKAYNDSFSGARRGDFGVWLALCKTVVNPASNIKNALLESLTILRHRFEETGYLEDKAAYVRSLCLLSDLYRKESALYQDKGSASQHAALRAIEYGKEAHELAQDMYTQYLIVSRLSLARADVALAEADCDAYNRPLHLLREASEVLGIDEGHIWTIEAELVADVVLLHGSLAAAAAAEQGDDLSLLMEARNALDYAIRHCYSKGIRGDVMVDLVRFHNDINNAIRCQNGEDVQCAEDVDPPERQESHGMDRRVWRGLGFLSWMLPKGLK